MQSFSNWGHSRINAARGESTSTQSKSFILHDVLTISVRLFWKFVTVAASTKVLGKRFQTLVNPKMERLSNAWCVPARLSSNCKAWR